MFTPILAISNDIRTIKNILTNEATLAVHWFKINLKEANADKFQFTLLGKNVCPETEYLEFSDVNIDVKMMFGIFAAGAIQSN